MTQTECIDCDFSENCDWGLIEQNMSPLAPICVARKWHEQSLKTFVEKTEQVRARIVTVGDFCKVERDYMGKGE